MSVSRWFAALAMATACTGESLSWGSPDNSGKDYSEAACKHRKKRKAKKKLVKKNNKRSRK
jgi:hypothetical protein